MFKNWTNENTYTTTLNSKTRAVFLINSLVICTVCLDFRQKYFSFFICPKSGYVIPFWSTYCTVNIQKLGAQNPDFLLVPCKLGTRSCFLLDLRHCLKSNCLETWQNWTAWNPNYFWFQTFTVCTTFQCFFKVWILPSPWTLKNINNSI